MANGFYHNGACFLIIGVILFFCCEAANQQEPVTKCTLERDKFTYHVVLSDHCETPPYYTNQLQNDKQRARQAADVNLEDHTRRLENLENTISKLLGGDVSKDGKPRIGDTVFPKNSLGKKEHRKPISNKFKEHPKRMENRLLNSLHKEFIGIRRELTRTKRRLRETVVQLNQTRQTLNKTEHELEGTRRRLRDTERRLEASLTDNLRMRRECEATQADLVETKSKLGEAEKRLRKKDIEVWKAQMEQDDLRKALEDCHRQLADARLALEQALVKYHELNLRHENATEQLDEQRDELVECYQGKTTQYCGFEDDSICGFEQDNTTDDQDWIRWSMATNSTNTGPTNDHTCQNVRGYYMYVEATSRAKDRRAKLKSPRYMGHVEQCVEFYYHMYGRSIGTLNVHTIVPGTNVVPLWRAFGNQGNVWTMARIEIPEAVAKVGYEVVFEAVLENGFAGDIAIDDFRVFDGKCYTQRVSVTFDRKAPRGRRGRVATPQAVETFTGTTTDTSHDDGS